MTRHELARLKLMRQPMRSRVAQIVQPCEKSGLVKLLSRWRHAFATVLTKSVSRYLSSSLTGRILCGIGSDWF